MKVLIAGASGMIGSALRLALIAKDHDVRTLVRRATSSPHEYPWHPERGLVPSGAIEWADAVINRSGASLGRLPWTQNYRLEILRSRVYTTKTLAIAILASRSPPENWLNASAVGIYGSRPGVILTEESPPGQGFLADVVTRWEHDAANELLLTDQNVSAQRLLDDGFAFVADTVHQAVRLAVESSFNRMI